MLLHLLAPFASVLAATPLLADVPLHAFEDLSVWKPNLDGGNPPEVSADREHARTGAGMRIRYTDKSPHWGNLTGPCQVPGEARALRFWVYKHAASPEAAMHIWLMEPDGDAWLQQVLFDGKSLAEAAVGWHEVRMPISGFSFQPRGRNTRELTTVNRMLLGCNYGNLEVTVDDMTWETGSGQAVLPLPKTEGLEIEGGKRGNVGILDMALGGRPSYATAHPPAKLAEALRAGGYGVTLLKPGDLADPQVLTPAGFDAVVLPYGPYFPLAAKEPFLAYLKVGGSFLSTDGYAFDQLAVLTEAGWSATGPERTAADMGKAETPPEAQPMNTRTGQPGDAMNFDPRQLGVFDPAFHLEHATVLHQTGNFGDLTYKLAKPVEGFSSCGLIGVNSPVFPPVYRRWIPVLEAVDGQGGGLRGTALAIMHNYAGEYPRSSWAFSGITSGEDLLLGDPKRRELLLRVVDDITQKVFLHDLTSDLACYRSGETAHVSVQVTNNGRQAAERVVTLSIAGRELARRSLRLEPGATQTVTASVAVDGLKSDYCPLSATMTAPSPRPPGTPLPLGEGPGVRDSLAGAFCIWDEKTLASGPKIAWSGNYLTVDGRPTFLIGSNQTGMIYYSPHETPAVWDQDFAGMAAHGFHVLRILHFSPFAKRGYEGDGSHTALDLANRPERLVRQMDAIVQLAQKHRVALFLSLHDWVGVGLTDEELKAEADWDRFWAERYKSAPGLFFDVQNEPSVDVPDRPDIVALWNRFLQERYGSDGALRAAWTKHPPEAALPHVPLGPTSSDWEDVRSADRKRFETVVLNRWVKANVDGIKAGNPSALACVGYLPSMPPADRILGVVATDFSNMHYYGPVDRFPLEFKIIDRRFVGKGLSIGECGAEEAHNARVAGSTSVPITESVRRFQALAHYAAALGGAYLGNWDWKDFDEMVFPWGLVHHTSPVTKPWLHTWEQEWLLLATAPLQYESPAVFVLAPDSNRIGPHSDELNGAVTRAVELLLDQRVNFGMANEEDLDRLPASAKALVWPVPYCPSDETFERVLGWVKAGGTLYLSGDVSFDRTRKPTRTERRTQLGLPSGTPLSPFATPDSAWRQPLVESTVGGGKVLFAPYPLELRGQASDPTVYRRLLELAGIASIRVEPAGAPVRALSIPTQDGGRLYLLARTSEGEDRLAVSLPEVGAQVELAGRGFAFVLVGPKGEVRAVESQGAVTLGGATIAKAAGHFGMAALDGRDLRQSRQVLVLPHQCETVGVVGLAGLQQARCHLGPPTGDGGQTSALAPTLTFSPGTPGQVAVLAPTGDLDAAMKRVRGMLALRF